MTLANWGRYPRPTRHTTQRNLVYQQWGGCRGQRWSPALVERSTAAEEVERSEAAEPTQQVYTRNKHYWVLATEPGRTRLSAPLPIWRSADGAVRFDERGCGPVRNDVPDVPGATPARPCSGTRKSVTCWLPPRTCRVWQLALHPPASRAGRRSDLAGSRQRLRTRVRLGSEGAERLGGPRRTTVRLTVD